MTSEKTLKREEVQVDIKVITNILKNALKISEECEYKITMEDYNKYCQSRGFNKEDKTEKTK